MAKYSYPYKCGHGQGVVNLGGKSAERERKLDWYALNFVCPDCFKKQKAEEDAAAEKTASLHLGIYDKVYLSIQVHGQIAANKDTLKQIGYRWDEEIDGGLLAIFKKPKLALQKWAVVSNANEITTIAKQWQDELSELGYKITSLPTAFDQNAVLMHFDYVAKKAEEERKLQEAAAKAEAEKQARIKRLDPKPTAPEWYRKIRAEKKYWNRKFYGNNKYGWRIYVDDCEQKITETDKAAFEKWEAELKEWHEFWKD
ncbi:hypothetical protein [Neisseria dumasiana]|uniref:Uncharacterized protein n=1 Tax=Neisseria dumasiana TaxID=1931275 RepID=A0A1X3DIT6_9NEIS|nr:hypothetical protein [Neisseria dumasiana]OSI21677.1 hypothetical protein BV912_06405 [Neisseria dumasiana]